MRMQSGTIPIFALLAAPLLWAGGCSDLSAGRQNPPSGPPRLVKLLVQDATFVGGPPAQRSAAVDLIDDAPPIACSDIQPCANQFLLAQTLPPLDCQADGFCIDPLKLTSAGVPLNGGATAIRAVFDKLLDGAALESVDQDANGAPKGTHPYHLKDGLFELLGPDGNPVAGTTGYWDNSGASDFTSDVILLPFGPALVVKPGSLLPQSHYVLRLHPSKLVDKSGQALADKNGAPLPDPQDYPFTTEGVAPNAAGSYPDFSTLPAKAPQIAPNEVLQFAFWTAVDDATVAVTATGPTGFDAALVEAYLDRGASPVAADCAMNENPQLVDFVYSSGSGAARVPADWPAGNYTFRFTVKDAQAGVAYDSGDLAFTVAGADGSASDDVNSAPNHVTPEQCK